MQAERRVEVSVTTHGPQLPPGDLGDQSVSNHTVVFLQSRIGYGSLFVDSRTRALIVIRHHRMLYGFLYERFRTSTGEAVIVALFDRCFDL